MEGKRIGNCLIIDSNPEIKSIIDGIEFLSIQLMPFESEQVHTLEEAFIKLHSTVYKIIVFDTALIGKEIEYFFSRVYLMSPTSKLIALSVNSSYEMVRMCFLNGVLDYLIKPIDKSRFINAIRRSYKGLNFEFNAHENAKIISNKILNLQPLNNESLVLYLKNFDSNDALQGDLIQKFSLAIFLVLVTLPQDPVKISDSFLSRVGAEWIVAQPDYEGAFCRAMHFLAKAYIDLYYPQVTNTIVRNTIHVVLKSSDDPKTVAYVAKELYLNQSHLSVTFKKHTGIALSSYITHVKIYGAMVLLLSVDLCFDDVLDIIVYKDKKHFEALFKKHVGCSVADYTQKHRKYKFFK